MNQSSPKETPCPDCGEMVRINSLRCWNCGAFMNPDMEKRFLAMQANPSPTIFSEMPSDAATTFDDSDDDDDFQISVPVLRSEPEVESDSAKTAADFQGSFLDDDDEESADEAASSESSEVESAPAANRVSDDSGTAHSVATGGDVLLNIAIQEEQDRRKRTKGRRPVGGMKTPGGGLLIFCPYGCRVVVKEQHRGMTGKCPRCEAPFIVPVDPPKFKKPQAEAAQESSAEAQDNFGIWLTDLHLHVVSPEKLKLKADSLLKDFVEVDVGFSKDQLLIAALGKKTGGGLFTKGGTDKKVDLRQTLIQHLKDGKSLDELAVGTKYVFTHDDMTQTRVVQPAASRADSIFHGIPVFGEGRIAIQLPHTEQTQDPTYLSMGLTQFWQFAKAMEDNYQITDLAGDRGIPPKHVYSTYKCHYTDVLVKALENTEFYRADPTVELEVAGYRCSACQTVVSEAGRKKENLGGKGAKAIAKAKCPKCSSKMGDNPLYSLKAEVAEPSMSGSESES